MSELVIEKLSEENFSEFIDLMDEFAHDQNMTPPDEESKKRLKVDGIGQNAKYECYLGKIKGRFVSYVIFFMTYGSFKGVHSLFLEDIYVLDELQRKGIGKQMLNFAIKIAKDRDCARLDLNVLEWNKKAINFYETNKFKNLKKRVYRLEREQFD